LRQNLRESGASFLAPSSSVRHPRSHLLRNVIILGRAGDGGGIAELRQYALLGHRSRSLPDQQWSHITDLARHEVIPHYRQAHGCSRGPRRPHDAIASSKRSPTTWFCGDTFVPTPAGCSSGPDGTKTRRDGAHPRSSAAPSGRTGWWKRLLLTGWRHGAKNTLLKN